MDCAHHCSQDIFMPYFYTYNSFGSSEDESLQTSSPKLQSKSASVSASPLKKTAAKQPRKPRKSTRKILPEGATVLAAALRQAGETAVSGFRRFRGRSRTLTGQRSTSTQKQPDEPERTEVGNVSVPDEPEGIDVGNVSVPYEHEGIEVENVNVPNEHEGIEVENVNVPNEPEGIELEDVNVLEEPEETEAGNVSAPVPIYDSLLDRTVWSTPGNPVVLGDPMQDRWIGNVGDSSRGAILAF